MLEVGQSIESGTAALTTADCVAFAQSFDPQPMHVDHKAAEDSFFGQLVASGWHVLSATMRLVVDARPFGEHPLIGAEIKEIRFARPVEPDTVIRARVTLQEILPRSAGGNFALLLVETLDDGSGDVLVKQGWKMLLEDKE
ncbi:MULTISPECIES: MaoC/PaaZ C-terminal domain-containing protein [Donghicola]|jgi:acyl dehydratase|uniref:MaoC/PaaZ C-terminal domain-containing protein n=1 Tax=Donghicola TaxID=393277 RepID=UPI0008EB83B3|nr:MULTISPECIES: MaoC/PaaZ C-terminal domain-containing protein [Donghicola]MCT4577543.1 MaoC/PaaZ C-terminal domain-containing protein [Donghicola sp.]SFQ78077.1 MaoC like domain-containing protein [Donghicola eburneus]